MNPEERLAQLQERREEIKQKAPAGSYVRPPQGPSGLPSPPH